MKFGTLFSDLSLWLREKPLRTKIAIIMAADFTLLMFLIFAAFALRVSNFEFPQTRSLHLYLFAPLASVLLATVFGVYHASTRHFTFNLERRIIFSQLLVPAFWSVLLLAFGTVGFARSILVIYLVLSIAGMIALRRAASIFFAGTIERRALNRERIPTLIFGAGQDGLAVLEAVNRQGRYKALAFLDTDYTLIDRVVGGIKVFTIEQLDQVMAKYAPREVIIAKQFQNRANKRTLVDSFVSRGLIVKTAPALQDIVDGNLNLSDVRPVNVEDLLGRDPVPPERFLMEKAIKGQVVMVTGAGGSIGSELVRQAVQYNPAKVVMVENSEFALFEIHREMEGQLSQTDRHFPLIPILADVRDKQRMAEVMKEQKIDIVFHAAAYKHVRMVQENASAGIDNNVFGTRSVAEAAMENRVKRFILISTDKAVRPTSIMGASKRVAEMIVQALAAQSNHNTIFSMVRFGNVLGSTGSVVPLFREQIAKGGPITVTHPDVTRYFMLIPEAAQLVIQAGAMAEGGEVYVLDMGEPIKILDLAETMVELAGLSVKSSSNPDGDIEIVFSGLKPGEKLFEELQIGNDITSTAHPRVMKSREFMLDQVTLSDWMSKLTLDDKTKKIHIVETLANANYTFD
jgi:FlaA1/EpsC-like NDP-sugar epimerase